MYRGIGAIVCEAKSSVQWQKHGFSKHLMARPRHIGAWIFQVWAVGEVQRCVRLRSGQWWWWLVGLGGRERW